MFADITKMSLGGLKAMQQSIRERLIEEDKQPSGQPKVYGVREFADWKEMSDQIEAELDDRGESYAKVPW